MMGLSQVDHQRFGLCCAETVQSDVEITDGFGKDLTRRILAARVNGRAPFGRRPQGHFVRAL
jgi:hypothetical protein